MNLNEMTIEELKKLSRDALKEIQMRKITGGTGK
ncbi:hypothetical protein PSYJYH_000025 [Bacillus phage PSYJ-YH]|nr:hypothetical protein PSYJYH_000025 [Bacillus phage PSYJ-YH]